MNSFDRNKAYDNFIEIFSSLYDEFFPKNKNKGNQKNRAEENRNCTKNYSKREMKKWEVISFL